jgi:hypothetical protein
MTSPQSDLFTHPQPEPQAEKPTGYLTPERSYPDGRPRPRFWMPPMPDRKPRDMPHELEHAAEKAEKLGRRAKARTARAIRQDVAAEQAEQQTAIVEPKTEDI